MKDAEGIQQEAEVSLSRKQVADIFRTSVATIKRRTVDGTLQPRVVNSRVLLYSGNDVLRLRKLGYSLDRSRAAAVGLVFTDDSSGPLGPTQPSPTRDQGPAVGSPTELLTAVSVAIVRCAMRDPALRREIAELLKIGI